MTGKNKILIIYILLLLSIVSTLSFSQDKDSLTINYNLINSVPQDAGVYFNGNYIGNTPYRFIFGASDSANGIDVVLKLKGYTDFSFKVTKDYLPLNKTVNLVYSGKKQSLHNDIVIENKSSQFKSPRKFVPIVISSVVAASGAILGYVFKTKANDFYDEYVETGDRSKLDETKKYDLYSALSLVAFQAGFTVLIYYLLIQ
jgi:hypothetical protein